MRNACSNKISFVTKRLSMIHSSSITLIIVIIITILILTKLKYLSLQRSKNSSTYESIQIGHFFLSFFLTDWIWCRVIFLFSLTWINRLRITLMTMTNLTNVGKCWLRTHTTKFYKERSCKLLKRYEKCLNLNCDFFFEK